jgi:hypothetical protein
VSSSGVLSGNTSGFTRFGFETVSFSGDTLETDGRVGEKASFLRSFSASRICLAFVLCFIVLFLPSPINQKKRNPADPGINIISFFPQPIKQNKAMTFFKDPDGLPIESKRKLIGVC